MLTVPAPLADVAPDINNDLLTPRAVNERVRHIVDFVTRAIDIEP